MELNEHFLNLAATESLAFEAIVNVLDSQNFLATLIPTLIEDNFEKLKSSDASQKHLKSLRLLLCQQYKLNYVNVKDEKIIRNSSKFSQFIEFLKNSKLCTRKENQSILHDIIVLQLVLFEDQKNFIEIFEDFQANGTTTTTTDQLTSSKLSTEWYLKILRCFLEAWEVLYFLNDRKESRGMNKTHLESCKKVLLSSVMYDLQTWMQNIENNQLYALHSVLLKVVSIARSTKILSPYIQEVLNKNFTTLCVMCDIIFPLHPITMDVDYSLIYSSKLWSKIQDNLISKNSQERKQAQYLFKKLIDFTDINEECIKMSTPSQSVIMNPFICHKIEEKTNVNQNRINFILITEALEEKQKHLVIPSLSLLDSLIEVWIKHKSCGNCFDFSWIYCVISRILAHDNNAIVKWGLLKSLDLHADAYNYEPFIKLIIMTLNNTFLYEKQTSEVEPEIVLALTAWFNNFQNENLPLLEKFVNCLSEVSWGPVAIFYVLQSILHISDKIEKVVSLQQEQLDMIRSLVETNIKLHPPMLRSMSQVTLLQILSRFSEIQNLMVLASFLSVFSLKDIKEPKCWSALTSWVAKINYNNALNFVNQMRDEFLIDHKNMSVSMSTFSLIIQLLYEAKVIFQVDKCAVGQKLITILIFLDRVDVRPYVKVPFITKIIDFIFSLFDLQRPSPEFIFNIFINYKEAIFKFILRLFHNENFSYEDAKICSRALQIINCHVEDAIINNVSVVTTNNRKELEEKCIQVLSNANKHNEVQLLFALESWSNISNCCKYDNVVLLEKINNLLKISRSEERVNGLTGKIGLDYYSALSKFIKNHVSTLHANDLKKNDWIQVMSIILDAAGNEVLIHFGEVVRLHVAAINDNNKKLEDLKFLIKSFWSCNFGSKRNKIFWLVAQKLTESINSSEILKYESIQDVSLEFTDRMLTDGDTLQGLKYILLTFTKISLHFKYFAKALLNGLLHGQVMRRDQRIFMQTCMKSKSILNSYKLKNGKIENFEVHEFINRQCNVDATIRAVSAIQLCKVLHDTKENASVFLSLVLEKLSTVENKRYYADSQLHRIKHRLMQSLLILQPCLNKESTQVLYHVIRDSLIQDTEQHSVRMMKEWLLIRIYLCNEDLFSDLWIFFDKICDERPSSVNSLICVIWHVAQKLPNENLSKFIKMALSKLAICCMGQQFNMRLFGQVFFIKLYELLPETSDIKVEYAILYKAMLESTMSGNFKKHPVKIDEDFFYTIFDPIKHYSLESIYHQLPRLSNISTEEWITKENFEDQILLNDSVLDIRISNIDCLLDKADIPYSILKSNDHTKLEEINNSQMVTDMQKKITPWKAMLPNEEELAQIADISNMKNDSKPKQDIILIASLVEKSQNLGGIARTCEIFGVKELVVSNLKQIEDKEFQVLSVSADKWIKIIEVKSFSLTKYLQELRDCGWTLVGAEQTAKSIHLFDMKFPKQTALILGNEKNGIPANIIPLLDICVEVPQFGIIRSLNVHVTSAICIWEYVKQYQNVT